jgi:DNA-binding LacI/PurR family transcriptional regulator
LLSKPEKATIYSIAKEANVSVATVSRFFNKPYVVKESTRKKLLKICNKYKYEPSKIASAITTKKSKTVAILLPSFKEPPFMDLISGAEFELSNRGYCLIVFNVRQVVEREFEILNIINNRFIDGVIFSGVYGNNKDKAFISEMFNREIPCVMVDRIIPDIDIPYVASNDYLGGKIAANYLIKNNHKKIGILTYDRSVYIFNQRVQGFNDFLKKYGLKSEFIFDISLEFKKIEIDILEKKKDIINSDVTAIFNTSDSIAIALMKVLIESGLKIPDNKSVMGYDDIVYSNLIYPHLSTVHHDMYKIGRKVAEVLLYRLENGNFMENKLILDPVIIPRDSVKKI